MRLRKLLVNNYECLTHEALSDFVKSEGCQVFPKVRLGDVFQISQSGISEAEYSYALKAHFDFVVCDSDFQPLFAVEFDEPYHDTDKRAIFRDNIKAGLCEKANFPLLRIASEHLETVNSLPILCWICDVWFRAREFRQAQESGQIPQNEIFIYSGILELWVRTESGDWREIDARKDSLIDLDSDWTGLESHRIQVRHRDPFIQARARLAMLEQQHESITGRHTEYNGKDRIGRDNAVVMIPVRDGYIIEHVQCRAFKFPQVSSLNLTADLAIWHALESLRQYFRGLRSPVSQDLARSWTARANSWKVV